MKHVLDGTANLVWKLSGVLEAPSGGHGRAYLCALVVVRPYRTRVPW
jgi:hypothetical protein